MEVRRSLTPSPIGIEVESSLVTSGWATNDRVTTLHRDQRLIETIEFHYQIHIRFAEHNIPDGASGSLPMVHFVSVTEYGKIRSGIGSILTSTRV